jgi:hypothetical protein
VLPVLPLREEELHVQSHTAAVRVGFPDLDLLMEVRSVGMT